jgi:hypothetical protein
MLHGGELAYALQFACQLLADKSKHAARLKTQRVCLSEIQNRPYSENFKGSSENFWA